MSRCPRILHHARWSKFFIFEFYPTGHSTLIKVPEDLDKQVAVDALKAMSVGIDKLTPKQIEYMHSW